MSKRTIALIAVLAILAAVLVVVALSPKNQPAAQIQQGTSATTTPTQIVYPKESVLTLSPNPLVVQATSTVPSSISVDLTTGVNEVTAVQLELSYDPKLVTITAVTPGTFFENPVELMNDIDAQNGRVTYAIAIQPVGSGKKGSGTVAKLNITPVAGATGNTTITLLPKTLVTASGVPSSVLKEALGTSVVFTK